MRLSKPALEPKLFPDHLSFLFCLSMIMIDNAGDDEFERPIGPHSRLPNPCSATSYAEIIMSSLDHDKPKRIGPKIGPKSHHPTFTMLVYRQ